eukprot:jgi/Botrbrau1/9461/Bobra.0252s0082.1
MDSDTYDSDYDDYENDVNSSDDDGYEDFEHDLGEIAPSATKAKYTVYSPYQLREKKNEKVLSVKAFLSQDSETTERLLRAAKWDQSRVHDNWFGDEDKEKKKLGIIETVCDPNPDSDAECRICFDTYPKQNMCCSNCRHYFCKDCWAGYVSEAINNGPSVLNLRCPQPECSAAVPRSVVMEVLPQSGREKFEQYELRSYVDDNKKLTWCPAPNCENAVESLQDIGNEPLDVTCKCGCPFCFQCKEEAHRPVDCGTVGRWIIKNSAESENLNWILANTKSCPKCKRPIEKNQGCMHMTCSQCKHEFCWLCQGSWQEHGERTGGFYACNRYETAKKKGEYDEESQRREQAKNSLERYMHYYQRWAENDKARLAALESLRETAEKKMDQLSEISLTPSSQLKFVVDAWGQVVDCRRILKWTYTYGYYRFGDQANTDKLSKDAQDALQRQQEFFEFNQGQAEYFLEALHSQVEKQLTMYIDGSEDSSKWPDFRQNLIGLTDVTRSHFDKLVSELEKGLDNLVEDYGGKDMDVEDAGGSSSRASTSRGPKLAKAAGAKRKGRGRGGVSGAGLGDSEAEDMQGFWVCGACTVQNTDLNSETCAVCNLPRTLNIGRRR